MTDPHDPYWRATPSGKAATMRSLMETLLAFTGVVAAGPLGYVVLSGALAASGIQAWASSLTSYALMIPLVYLAQRNLTFRSQTRHRSLFPRYVATQFLGLTLSGLLPYFLVQGGRAGPFVAFVFVAILVATMNFALLKLWAFAAHEQEAKRPV